jgi:hypothetical protein
MSRIKAGMRQKCKNKVFRDAAEAGMTPEMEEELMLIIHSMTVDATILELLGQCLHDFFCSAATVDRAYHNELVTHLFPLKVRRHLSNTVRNGDHWAVMHLLNLPDKDLSGEPPPDRSEAFETAQAL